MALRKVIIEVPEEFIDGHVDIRDVITLQVDPDYGEDKPGSLLFTVLDPNDPDAMEKMDSNEFPTLMEVIAAYKKG